MVDKNWQPEFHEFAIGGDRRYTYIPFDKLSHHDQYQIKHNRYPHKSSGKYTFVDEHYLYPVKKNYRLANARRELAIPYKLVQDDTYMESIGYEKNAGW